MEQATVSSYRRALQVLERIGDTELCEAYERFATRLEQVLTPDEQAVYTSFQQRTTGGSIPPDEQAVADKVAGDAQVNQLYDKYLAVLSSRRPDGAGS